MRSIRTPRAREKFLEALASHGIVEAACQAAAIGKTAVYDWRADDAEFAEAWDAALEQSTAKLEQEAVRRAMDKSDHLMVTLLKARKPDLYRDRIEHTGPRGGAIQISRSDSDRLAQIREIVDLLGGAAILPQLGFTDLPQLDVIDVEADDVP